MSYEVFGVLCQPVDQGLNPVDPRFSFFLRALYPKDPSFALVEFLQARFKNIKLPGMLRSDAGADLVVASLRQHRVLQVVPCCLSPPLLLLLPPQPLLPDLAAGHRRKDASFLCSLPAGGRSLWGFLGIGALDYLRARLKS
ncbi:hypothetical protein BHE74_00024524 [Ensete ventricosum]|nr:hypothetical protein BHE74_00024524 [Ensete ventricosum]